MDIKYKHLLSPFKIGNTVLKNRMVSTNSLPLFLQGPEPFPAEGVFAHYINKAKNGAAIVTCTCGSDVKFTPPTAESAHFASFDIFNPQCQNYLSQLVDAIHFYGAKASITPLPEGVFGYDVSESVVYNIFDPDSPPVANKEISEDQLFEIVDAYEKQARVLQAIGFDILSIHMAYIGPLQARFLSPLTNKRTDKYGGSIGNRARFPLMVFKRIREVCGKDLLLEGIMSAVEPEGGITIEDTIAFAKMAEGCVDILQLRTGDIDNNHPTGFNPNPRPFTDYARAVKDSGAQITVATVGGYQDLEASDEVVASGSADLIYMGRCWVSNPEYGTMAYEGRNEDVVPCIRCNKCQVEKTGGPFHSVCSVNPMIGIEHLAGKLLSPPGAPRKVAVIGGGPAGMEAAIVAAKRGHDVTLYEREASLGGQLRHTDHAPFKWPLRNYKDYLILQLGKSGVKVLLNTAADPDTIKTSGFDAVLTAVGADPIVPRIPGIEAPHVVYAEKVFGNEASIGEDVVVIGGGDVGAEAGLYLAEKGHRVTILEMRDRLAPDATPVFYRSILVGECDKEKNLTYILNARCTIIEADRVKYMDADGGEHMIEAGSVVVAAGTKARTDEALQFYGTAARFHTIGDCDGAGNVQKSIRSAFSIASTL